MTLSSFSLVLGAYLYVFGFPLVFADDRYVTWLKKFIKDENLLRLAALPFVAIAVTTLGRQWQVSMDGEGLIVLLAWLTLAKSLLLAWWPARIIKLKTPVYAFLLGEQPMQMFTGFVMVLLGALFTYLGLMLP